MLCRILRRRSLAEEVLQEVFLQAWRQLPLYRQDLGTVVSWLLMMARSRGLDRLRHEGAFAQRNALHGCESSQTVPSLGTARLEEGERRSGLHWALAELPAEQRICIELALYEGLTHTEIAIRLATPLGTVKSRVRMGMTKIRESLASGDPRVRRRSDAVRPARDRPREIGTVRIRPAW